MGRKMKIDGELVPYGIGTHANCVLAYLSKKLR
jgi:hypothetical protein